MPRRLRAVVVALCVMLAVSACDGLPAGSGGTVRRLAALDIVNSPPPQGVLVAYQEDLGSAVLGAPRDPSVTVAYATPASIDQVRTFFLTSFPAFGVAEQAGGDDRHAFLSGQDADTFVSVSITFDEPHYTGHSTPSPSPAPAGATLYVVVDASPRAGQGAPAGISRIGVVHGDSLVDTDGDGVLDALRIPVSVDVNEPDDYALVVDVVDATGNKVSAHGFATLAAGAGVVNVDLPLDTMVSEGMSGRLTLVNGILARGSTMDFVTTASEMGTTAAYNPSSVSKLSTLAPTEEPTAVISQFVVTVTDTDGDGVLDTATYRGTIFVPTGGGYVLTAKFVHPDQSWNPIRDVVNLDAGTNLYSLVVPMYPESRGPGTYTLRDVLLELDGASSRGVAGPDTSFEVGVATT